MIIISFGIVRSGSTLAFEMAKAVLELTGHPQQRLTNDLVAEGFGDINFVRNWSDECLARLIDAAKGTRIVIKTHRSPAALSPAAIFDAIDAGELKIHVVFRDPRDTILSMMDHSQLAPEPEVLRGQTLDLDAAISRLGNRLQWLRQWGGFPSLKLQYERIAFDPIAGPNLITEDFGVTADPADVWEIVDRSFTQKNVARPDRHRTDLSPEHVARIERAFPLYLELVRGHPYAGWFEKPR